MKKRTQVVILAAMVLGVLSTGMVSRQSSQNQTVIRITAMQFEFKPAEITVKKGETVVLELNAEDRAHGFNLTDLHVRTDIKPGQVARITIKPEKAGRYPFACDVFCGSGHEDMVGVLIVTD